VQLKAERERDHKLGEGKKKKQQQQQQRKERWVQLSRRHRMNAK
jgi:hypothetical protein